MFKVSNIPEGVSGNFEIVHFDLSKSDALRYNVRHISHGYSSVAKGSYVRLMENSETWMSNTDMERRINTEFKMEARGNVLIFGLGIGAILEWLGDEINKLNITIVEKNQDVINLVAPYLPDNIKVVCGDAFEFVPDEDQKFDTIYFDIWINICEDNFEQMKELESRAKSWANPGAWISSWSKNEITCHLCNEVNSECGCEECHCGEKIDNGEGLCEMCMYDECPECGACGYCEGCDCGENY